MAAITAPYGSWVSPITSDVVIKESISVMDVSVDPFQEGRILLKDVKMWVKVLHTQASYADKGLYTNMIECLVQVKHIALLPTRKRA